MGGRTQSLIEELESLQSKTKIPTTDELVQMSLNGLEETPAPKKKVKKEEKTVVDGRGAAFEELAKMSNPFTEYDRFQVDMNWISEAHARAYESLQYALRELRKKDRTINELRRQLNKAPVYPEYVPMQDPPFDEEISEMVMIPEHRTDQFASIAMIAIIFVGVALLLAFIGFLFR